MKVSLNWVKQLTTSVSEIPTNELIEKIGVQLGAIEEVQDLSQKYRGIYVVKVVSCADHPDSDHLHLCKVDDGGKVENVERDANGLVQVVCGAPNVREGILAAWIPPGIVVPSTLGHDPLILEARRIRGEISNGMLASPKELALSDSHEGILEVSGEANPGDELAKVYELDDTIIDIENKMFTHRPDCFGVLGVAREIAGIQNQAFKSPEWYLNVPSSAFDTDSTVRSLKVENKARNLVPRFMAIGLDNVKVGPSPMWLQSILARTGHRSINNVVDITNYIMLLTGQPLHAYDANKLLSVSGSSELQLETRMSSPGDSLKLLGGKQVNFSNDSTILITSGDKPVGIGGIMGGAETEVDDQTTSIVLECATFDMYNIRRSSMQYGLFTDAVTRFTKGQGPMQNDRVLAQAVAMLKELTGAKTASQLVDDQTNTSQVRTLKVDPKFVNDRLGLNLTDSDMQRILNNVEFKVEIIEENILHISVPFWRMDIEIAEDIVEEVGRLYGYDKLPLILPSKSLSPAAKNPMIELKNQLRSILAASGANELLTYSFVHGNLMDKARQDRSQAFQLNNAISPDLQYYRLSILPSLLDKVHANIKAGYSQFALYEIGKVYSPVHLNDEGVPSEADILDFVYCADDKVQQSGAAYYQAKNFLTVLIEKLGLKPTFNPVKESSEAISASPFDAGRSAIVGIEGSEDIIGLVGEFKTSVYKELKLPGSSAGYGINLNLLLKLTNNQLAKYTVLPRFPKVEQDICFRIPVALSYAQLFNFVNSQVNELREEKTTYEIAPLDIYQKPEDRDYKQITFRLSIASYEKTMTDQEVARLLDQVAANAKQKLSIERV